ncbi:LppX_LprAFG lipoprotein [Nocardioides marmoraquaticus]
MRPRRRPLLPALAVVASLTLVAGCGGGGGDDASGSDASGSSSESSEPSGPEEAPAEELTVDDLGERVAAAFSDAGSVAFELEQSTQGQESSGTGEADLSGDELSSTVDLDTPQGTVSVIATDGLFYLKIPQLTPDGKWLEVDPEADSGLGALIGQLGGSADPAASIEVLGEATKVTPTGEEEIAGVATTGYRVTLPREAIAESIGADPRITQLLPEELDYDVWVDADDLVRRVASTVEVQGTSSTTTVTYTDYGQPVDIEAPPAGQVTDQAPGLPG